MHPWSAGWWLVSNELKPLLYHARHCHILREAELLADRVHLGLAGQLPARVRVLSVPCTAVTQARV